MKKEILKCDILIGITIILMLAVQFITVVVVTRQQETTGAEIEAVHQYYESNPIAEHILNLGRLARLFQVLVAPALIFSCYILFRKKVLIGKVDLHSFTFFVLTLFVIFFLNFLNDLAVLLGRVLL